MKRRAMKKWIPEGVYCYDNKTKCKWRKYYGAVKRNRSNCNVANECKEECWTKPENSCYDLIYRCEYLRYTDFTQESLLWDACKECGVKDDV